MAFFRGPQSPRDEPFVPNSLSPPQRNQNRWSASMAGMGDVRGALQRRFTTNTVPTLSPIGQQRRQAAGDVQMSERAARHYEQLLQAQRKIQEELEKVDLNTRREVDENIRHEQSVTQLFAQSEPSTPPEYSAFPTAFSRPNRYSAASLTSPAGIDTRPHRSSVQLTSPSAGFARIYNNNNNNNGNGNGNGNVSNLPSQSVPGSRRQSDGEDDEDDFLYGYEDSVRRAAMNPNRNSMPITAYDRKRNTADLSLGQMSVAGFVFDDNEKSPHQSKSNQTSPPDLKTYLQVQHTADGFPKLIRREENGESSLSAVSAALDLASPVQDSRFTSVADRAAASRHRISLPPSALGGSINIIPLNGILANASENRAVNRRSMEVKFSAETKRPALLTTPPRGFANGSSSYSTNDLPTMKSVNVDEQSVAGGVPVLSPALQSAALTASHISPEQSSGQLTRFNTNPQSQEYSRLPKDGGQDQFNLPQSVLQANAAPFGPGMHNHNQIPGFASPTTSPYAPQPAAYYGGYGMQMVPNGFNHMNVGPHNGFGNVNVSAPNGFSPQGQWPAHAPGPYPHAPLNHRQGFSPAGYNHHGTGRFESTRANNNQRRQAAEEAQAKFQSIRIDQLVGEIYTLCKDQHGCRFLQRKLEERDEETVQLIFEEVHKHMVELMVDPFGNYLCQKLLESTNDEQRTALIRNAMPAMTKIALNQHGTRALQKMIEFISTPEQTALIIEALRNDVVQLIQDLNGNHVIQKCLNHLSSHDAIFIFEAVGAHCITVGTHRHGCCVLQRCIDHADGMQKGKMVQHIINNAYSLVQDPFGNYVVQYILDLGEPSFINPLCQAFLGEIVTLSRQKFSSNVIEKCIRTATGPVRRDLVSEIMHPQNIEKLLRDGFANYVVQTAMEFSDEDLKAALMENIRVVLPAIRNTPHGRRIQGKINDWDNRHPNTSSSLASANVTSPVTDTSAQQMPGLPRANRQGMVGAPPNWPGTSSVVEGFTSPVRNGDYGTANGVSNGETNRTTNGFSNVFSGDSIASPTPQRGNFGIFHNAQNYQAIAGAQEFQSPQPYGHF